MSVGVRGAWGMIGGRRVELRLAVRQARRAWPTSLLVISLVAIPMMLVSGAATFAASRMPAPEETITTELGRTQSWLMIVGGDDPTRRQAPDDPYWFDVDRDEEGMPLNPEMPAPDDLTGLMQGVELLEVGSGQVTVETSAGAGLLPSIVGDATDDELDGRYELLDGRRPQHAGEALVSPGALTRLDARVGDTLTLIEPSATVTIVGVMKQVTHPSDDQVVFLPASVAPEHLRGAGSETMWFAPDWQPSGDQLTALNRAGVIVYARDAVAASGARSYVDPASAWSMAGIGAIVAGFTGYLVILLAGAGFAVSARRQQRSLAIAASVGADRASVFRIVMLQGTVLGLVGGVLGAGIGVALAYPALVLLDDGAAASFWGFHAPWWSIVGIVLFATTVGTASALVPARAATRGDVLASLRGSRTPPRVHANRPFWGALIAFVGAGLTATGGLGLATLNAAETIDYDHPLRPLFLIAIVAGPLLFQIGVIVAGHWLLFMISRGASRLGLSARVAARDAAANPGRIVPAFAAVGACAFIASFAMTSVSVFTEQTARNWNYQAPLGSVTVSYWPEDAEATGFVRGVEALEQTGPDSIGIVREDAQWYSTAPDGADDAAQHVTAEVIDYVDCARAESGPCMMRADALFGTSSPIVVSADDLDTVLGVEVDDSTLAAFARGGSVVLDPAYLDGDEIILHRWNRGETDGFHQDWTESKPIPQAQQTMRVPAAPIVAPQRLDWAVILSPYAADRIGYQTLPTRAIGAYTTAPSQRTLDGLALIAQRGWNAGGFSYSVENGPPSSAPWLWLILGAAGVLVLGAGGVALGLARVERRPDDATLTAIGASPGIRRRIAFWQAIIIVGIGSVTGAVAGVIPMWGIVMQSQTGDGWELHMVDTPLPWLVLLAVGLPAVIAVTSWLLPARRPELTRRTTIT